MICPVCLRDVPKLIGSQQLCPDCFALAHQDVIPDVFGGLLVREEEERWGEAGFECDEGYVPEYSCGCVGEEEAWDWADGEPPADDLATDDLLDVEGFPPLFRGRPRF